MATIVEENRKTLRKAVNVLCGFRETSDEPTNTIEIDGVQDYEGLANLEPTLLTATIMDLAGNGFQNDGGAIPMQTDSDSYRYGYISEEVSKADGTFNNPIGLTIYASNDWEYITLEVRGQYGTSQVFQYEPVWSGGKTTVYVDKWDPGERVYIVGVFLGKAWIWNNSNLISANLDLHSVNTEIGGELEVSSIEIQAYEPIDYTDIIGKITQGAPIWYAAGYAGDMSRRRNFYLSEPITWDKNILRVCGQDATTLLDDYLPVKTQNYGSTTHVDYTLARRLESALSSIQYDTVGNLPPYGSQYVLAAQLFLYEGEAARSIISQYTGTYRDEATFQATYVDAGIPTLYYGDTNPNWTIYADEVSDLVSRAEANINRIEIDLPEYYSQYNSSVEEVEATAGKTYFIDLDPPCISVYISPTPTSSELINNETFKFVAAATTTYTISAYEALGNLTSGNNPYAATSSEAGVTKKLDYTLPLCLGDTPGTSLTHDAITQLLDRSNVVYEFTYRGNPHIQPRDVLNVEIASWETDYKTVTGLYPALDLYPDVDLYPYATYKKVRKMVKRWEIMTVDSVTLEHSQGGGLSSKITARKGAV